MHIQRRRRAHRFRRPFGVPAPLVCGHRLRHPPLGAAERDRLITAMRRASFAVARCLPWLSPDSVRAADADVSVPHLSCLSHVPLAHRFRSHLDSPGATRYNRHGSAEIRRRYCPAADPWLTVIAWMRREPSRQGSNPYSCAAHFLRDAPFAHLLAASLLPFARFLDRCDGVGDRLRSFPAAGYGCWLSLSRRRTIRPTHPALSTDPQLLRASGLVSPISLRDLLDRAVILGTFDNTYDASGKEMTLDALNRLANLVRDDGAHVVDRTVDISCASGAPSNDPAPLVMALVVAAGDPEIRTYAAQTLPLAA